MAVGEDRHPENENPDLPVGVMQTIEEIRMQNDDTTVFNFGERADELMTALSAAGLPGRLDAGSGAREACRRRTPIQSPWQLHGVPVMRLIGERIQMVCDHEKQSHEVAA